MKKYTLATETVTKEEMTPREKQIFNHGYQEGFTDGKASKQGNELLGAVAIGASAGIFMFFLAILFH